MLLLICDRLDKGTCSFCSEADLLITPEIKKGRLSSNISFFCCCGFFLFWYYFFLTATQQISLHFVAKEWINEKYLKLSAPKDIKLFRVLGKGFGSNPKVGKFCMIWNYNTMRPKHWKLCNQDTKLTEETQFTSFIYHAYTTEAFLWHSTNFSNPISSHSSLSTKLCRISPEWPQLCSWGSGEVSRGHHDSKHLTQALSSLTFKCVFKKKLSHCQTKSQYSDYGNYYVRKSQLSLCHAIFLKSD